VAHAAATAGSTPLDAGALIETLSSGDPAAAAGAAAAVSAAVAAAVVAKAARAAGQPGLVAQADALTERLSGLIRDDVAVYGEALTALADAGAGEGESPARDFRLGQLLERAAGVPVAVAEASADVAALATQIADAGDPKFRNDAVAAAMLAAGAARASAYLVEINLALGAEDAQVVRARAAVATADAALDGMDR
jgi:formiminotetrahydrofolate cyclodeaminase